MYLHFYAEIYDICTKQFFNCLNLKQVIAKFIMIDLHILELSLTAAKIALMDKVSTNCSAIVSKVFYAVSI